MILTEVAYINKILKYCIQPHTIQKKILTWPKSDNGGVVEMKAFNSWKFGLYIYMLCELHYYTNFAV